MEKYFEKRIASKEHEDAKDDEKQGKDIEKSAEVGATEPTVLLAGRHDVQPIVSLRAGAGGGPQVHGGTGGRMGQGGARGTAGVEATGGAGGEQVNMGAGGGVGRGRGAAVEGTVA